MLGGGRDDSFKRSLGLRGYHDADGRALPFRGGLGSTRRRHPRSQEVVCCDPFAWHSAGLVTNLGMMIIGSPGVGKTSLAKRQIRGLMACGATALILGDPKGEYVRVVESAGGQVVRVGRGLDRINPLDAGPLGAVLPRLTGAARHGSFAGGVSPAGRRTRVRRRGRG